MAMGAWHREIDAGLALLIGAPLEATVVAGLRGTPCRELVLSRVGDLWHWARGGDRSWPELAEAWPTAVPETKPLTVYEAEADGRLAAARAMTRTGVAKGMAATVARHIRARALGYDKGGRDGYGLWSRLRLLRRRRDDLVHLRRVGRDLAAHQGRFVYWPLQTEPEVALAQMSPEFFFQHAAIAALSRDLPVGVELLVKEHRSALGRRPRDFHDQLMALPNVAMLKPDEDGLAVIRRAGAVATITGAAGQEALCLGRRVLSFGRHNPWGFMPGCRVVTDLGDLRADIEWAMSIDANEIEQGKRLNGALRACSFRLDAAAALAALAATL